MVLVMGQTVRMKALKYKTEEYVCPHLASSRSIPRDKDLSTSNLLGGGPRKPG